MRNLIANIPIAPEGWKIGRFIFSKSTKRFLEPHTYAHYQLCSGQIERKSILSWGETEVMDVLFLYNFFMRGNACREEDSAFFSRSISKGILLRNEKFYECINIALVSIRETEWKLKHKQKILAFNWLLRSRVKDELQITFFNKWVVFELLNNYYDEMASVFKKTLGIKNFLIYRKYWRDIRNSIAHEGKCDYTSFKEKLMKSYPLGGLRFDVSERKFFTSKVRKKDFSEFLLDSDFVMDMLLTVYFSYVLGIVSPNKYYHPYYIQRMQQYDVNLKIEARRGIILTAHN